jgi:predicted dehydrogenase
MKPNSQAKVRYAVVGLGNIAQTAVLPAFGHAENSELVAIVSSDRTKRVELCKQYGVEFDGDYPDLEAILKEGRVDAVYIATPNSTHRNFALRAAFAGVHVLCEKPLASTLADAESIVEACERARVKLMTAYRLHFDVGTLTVLDHVSSGQIGEPLIFTSAFSHVVRPGDIRTSPEDGGGAALDLGVYCVNAARHLFQAEPICVSAALWQENGVDTTTSAILQFSKGRTAQFTVSNSAASVSSYRILGSEGDISVEPAYEYAEGLKFVLTRQKETSQESFAERDQFAPELIHFSDCILEDRQPLPSGEEGVADMRVIEAVLAAGTRGRPVTLEPRRYTYHPRLSQRIDRPPVSKGATVNAPSPSLK